MGSVVAKLTGEATMLNVDNVRNPDELFELIARSFHRSASRILSSDCKQRAGENIRTFGMRLRRCLAVCKLLNPDSLLHFFMQGINPSIRQGIESLLPHKFERAYEYAEDYENRIGVKSGGSKQVNFAANVTEITDGYEAERENRDLREKLRRKEEDLGIESRLARENRDLRERLARQGSELANMQSTSQKKSPFLGKCFCCQLPGHPFFQCPTATTADKDKVRKNYDELVGKMREERKKELNSRGPVTNPQ